MQTYNWVPKQGEEVQLQFSDGLVEIGKFIKDNEDGTCICKVGKKKFTFQNCYVSENWHYYKKLPKEKEVVGTNRRDEDEER